MCRIFVSFQINKDFFIEYIFSNLILKQTMPRLLKALDVEAVQAIPDTILIPVEYTGLFGAVTTFPSFGPIPNSTFMEKLLVFSGTGFAYEFLIDYLNRV